MGVSLSGVEGTQPHPALFRQILSALSLTKGG